jgi:hypothetical protein
MLMLMLMPMPMPSLNSKHLSQRVHFHLQSRSQ